MGSNSNFFSVVNTAILHDLRLVESADGEPQCGGPTTHYVWISDCAEAQYP